MIESISFLQWIAGIGGIGAVFAVLMFFVYRHDRKQSEDRLREDRKFMEDRLTIILADYNSSTKENTKIQSELFQYLKGKNGNR